MAAENNLDQPHAYRVASILPMTADLSHIQDGLLIQDGRLIADLGPYRELKKQYSGPVTDLGDRVMVPGLINAHTHLELSHLQGRTKLGQGFETWVKSLILSPLKKISPGILAHTLEELIKSGTVFIGDISGHNPRLLETTLSQSDLFYRLFIEFIGFKPPKGHRLVWPKGISPRKSENIGASGHALYSTHPTTLQLVKSWSVKNRQPFVIHLAEHPGELEFLTTGRGSFANLIKKNLVPKDFVPPEMTPVAYADRLGLLDEQSLAIHCVQINEKDTQILKHRDVSVCLCPRSNQAIDVGRAPWEKLYSAGIRLCLGTDSLASAPDLNLWEEAYYLARQWRGQLSLSELVSFMTVNPAHALGISGSLGTLQRGKIAAFSLVPEKLTEICQ